VAVVWALTGWCGWGSTGLKLYRERKLFECFWIDLLRVRTKPKQDRYKKINEEFFQRRKKVYRKVKSRKGGSKGPVGSSKGEKTQARKADDEWETGALFEVIFRTADSVLCSCI
jgi:choline dehydrogenase-like flavoprotein